MKFQIGLLMFCGLLSTSHAHAVRNDGYLAVVIGYHTNGAPEKFSAHDCSLSKWAEDDAMRNCMKITQICQLIETKRLYCNPTTQKCIC